MSQELGKALVGGPNMTYLGVFLSLALPHAIVTPAGCM